MLNKEAAEMKARVTALALGAMALAMTGCGGDPREAGRETREALEQGKEKTKEFIDKHDDQVKRALEETKEKGQEFVEGFREGAPAGDGEQGAGGEEAANGAGSDGS
jgi:hypothetical protein